MLSEKNLLTKSYQTLTRQRLSPLYFILLTLLFFYFIKTKLDTSPFQLILSQKYVVLAALGISMTFIFLKAFAWYLSWHSQNILISYFQTFNIFLIAAAVELLVYPAKVSADLFSISYLKNYRIAQKVKSVLLFRIGAITPFIVISFFWLAIHHVFYFGIGITIFMVVIIKFGSGFFKRLQSMPHLGKTLGSVIVISCLTILVEFIRISVLLSLFHFPTSIDFFLWFIVSHSLGVASGIPSGLGVKDVSLGMYLRGFIAPGDIALFLIISRLTGEIFTASLGWCVAGRQVFQLMTQANPTATTSPK